MRKWEVIKVNTGSEKPWRAFSPVCFYAAQGERTCRCKSFQTWAEALAHAESFRP